MSVIAVVAATLGSGLSLANASVIGTGTVAGSGGLTSSINWSGVFTGSGSASGSINGIVVTGRVLPTLNMNITGSGVIALGNMSSSAYSSGTVNIELGDNAVNGASITAKSTNGGMTSPTNTGVIINNLAADGAADSYQFTSASGTSIDSTMPGFVQ